MSSSVRDICELYALLGLSRRFHAMGASVAIARDGRSGQKRCFVNKKILVKSRKFVMNDVKIILSMCDGNSRI